MGNFPFRGPQSRGCIPTVKIAVLLKTADITEKITILFYAEQEKTTSNQNSRLEQRRIAMTIT